MNGAHGIAWWKSPVVSFLFRLLLGSIFVYAGVVKGMDPSGFAQAIYNYRILPGWMIHPMAILLPAVEVLVGLSLLLGVWVPGGSLLASSLLSAFAVALGLNLIRGLDIDCGCFGGGPGEGSGTRLYLVRDLVLLGMGLHVLRFDRGFGSISRLRGKKMPR
jgi:uncharacterized membrane protein YphA (DoxX/SURF4 family)